MTTAKHLQAVFDRMNHEGPRLVLMNFLSHAARAVERSRDDRTRSDDLRRLGVEAFADHDEIIEVIRKKLRHDKRLRDAGRDGILAPIGRWYLSGMLIAEGRLKRSTCEVAVRFSPRLEAAE